MQREVHVKKAYYFLDHINVLGIGGSVHKKPLGTVRCLFLATHLSTQLHYHIVLSLTLQLVIMQPPMENLLRSVTIFFGISYFPRSLVGLLKIILLILQK